MQILLKQQRNDFLKLSTICEGRSHCAEDCGGCSVGSEEEGGRLMNVDVVVLDEVHYLSDISRGTVWEETVLFQCPTIPVRKVPRCH